MPAELEPGEPGRCVAGSASRLRSRRGGFADAEARELAAARRDEMPRPLWRLRVIPKTLESARVTNIARDELASVSRESRCISDERLGQTAWQAGLPACLNVLGDRECTFCY